MIARFAAEDPFNTVSVDDTERDHTGVISFTTAAMRATYARFPELVLVDCTHKTNHYNYQLCTFMVVDENGEGQPIQHSLLESNSNWHMLCALRHFLDAHLSCATELRVLMVDKDLNEIRVLQGHFPLAQVLICTFHVKKYLSTVSRKPIYGRIATEDHDTLDNHVHMCMYAQSEKEYTQNREDLRAFCERINFNKFDDYFTRNWDNCKPMWVAYYRNKLPFFRVQTNNHLESFFGKFKKGIEPTCSMTECLKELFAKERIRENQLRYFTHRVGTYVNRNYLDAEMQAVLRFTTHFVAENVETEYARAKSKWRTYQYAEDDDGCFFDVQGAHTIRRVNTTTLTCSCPFSVNMKLPCRHAIALRLHTCAPQAIPLEAVNLRWSRLVHDLPKRPPFRYTIRDEADRDKTPVPRSRHERYNEASRALQPLTSEIAEISDDETFAASLNFVKDMWHNTRLHKRVPATSPATEQSSGGEEDEGDDDDSVEENGGDDDDSVNDDKAYGEESEGDDDDGAHDDTNDEDEDECKAPDEPMPLSQAHSLYSNELGSVRLVDTAAVALPQPTEDIQVSQDRVEGGDSPKPRRTLALRTLPEDYEDGADPYFRKVRINLNPRVSKVGHPSLDKEMVQSDIRQRQARFNEEMRARRANGNVTLVQLLNSLDA